MYCNNKAPINLTNNHVFHYQTKHIEFDRHFIREKIDFKDVVFPYVKSENQVVDMFTKGLSYGDFERNINKLNMFDMYEQLEGEC